MNAYPPGAGPEAARFSGTVYVPPASGAVGLMDPGTETTSSTRPEIATARAAADSAGRMVAVFTAPTTAAWLVRRIVVQSTIRGTCLVYVGTIDPGNLVSGTQSGDMDENDANQPYVIPEGESMRVHWLAGGVCSARIEYVEV